MAEEQQQAQDKAPAGEEFAEAFSARSAEMRGEQPKEPDPESGSNTQEGADAPSADKAGEAELEGGAKDAKPDSEAKPADKPADKAEKPDLWEGLTPEQEAYFRRVEQSERSQRGRVGALTRQLQSSRAAPKEPQKTEAKDPPKADEFADLEAEVRKATEDYPEVAGPMAKLIEQVKQRVDEVAETVKPIAESRNEAELAKAYEALGQKHPDYMDFIEGDKREKLIEWAQTQRPSIQQLLGSHDPEDVSLGLALFKAETGTEQELAKDEDDPEPKKTETDAKRERQLAGSKDTPDKGIPAASGAPNDFGAAFKARSEELKRKRQHA